MVASVGKLNLNSYLSLGGKIPLEKGGGDQKAETKPPRKPIGKIGPA